MNVLVAALVQIAIRIGRWLLHKLVDRGLERLVGYMDGKIDDFVRRRARARAAWRKRWLAGRISRWTDAMRWLEHKRAEIAERVATAACEAAVARAVPLVAACEVEPRKRAA